MDKTYQRDIEDAARIIKTARITGVTKRHVRHVINDDRNNELVFTTYMTLKEEEQEIENKLLAEVNKLVPFN